MGDFIFPDTDFWAAFVGVSQTSLLYVGCTLDNF